MIKLLGVFQRAWLIASWVLFGSPLIKTAAKSKRKKAAAVKKAIRRAAKKYQGKKDAVNVRLAGIQELVDKLNSSIFDEDYLGLRLAEIQQQVDALENTCKLLDEDMDLVFSRIGLSDSDRPSAE